MTLTHSPDLLHMYTTATQYIPPPPPPHCASLCTLVRKWANWHSKKHQCMSQVVTTTSAREVFALVDNRKTPPVEVAGDDHHRCKLCICSNWWLKKHQQRKLPRVNTIWAPVGTGCSNQLQWHKGTNPNQNLPLCYLELVGTCTVWWWFLSWKVRQVITLRWRFAPVYINIYIRPSQPETPWLHNCFMFFAAA